MNEPHVLFERRGVAGLVTLNRPRALNALTREMCVAIRARLDEWARDDAIRVVVIRGAGARAFCAGGDIRAVWESVRDGTSEGRDFFREEYRLNRAIRHFPKPYVALMHGIVMGGGAGVSVHGSHRAAGETLDFAMPETGIGMFPDIGASYFLSRAPGETGLYLALTGARIGVADALALGLVTHFVRGHDALLDRLAAGEAPDAVLGALAENPGPGPLAEHRAKVDAIFSAASAESIFEWLERDGSQWALGVAQTIRARSPLAVKIAFHEIRTGRTLSFDDCMAMEFRLAARIVATHDFSEGIRAAVIDKDRAPRWSPLSLAVIGDEKINEFFAPLDGDAL